MAGAPTLAMQAALALVSQEGWPKHLPARAMCPPHGRATVSLSQVSLCCQESKRRRSKQFTLTVSNILFDKALPFQAVLYKAYKHKAAAGVALGAASFKPSTFTSPIDTQGLFLDLQMKLPGCILSPKILEHTHTIIPWL